MHPELAAALGRLDAVTRDLHAAAMSMPTSLHCQKPSPERWCLNEVLEHLALVERLFVEAIARNIAAAKAAGLAPEVDDPAMLSDQLKTVVEDRTTPRTAPERVVPTGQVGAAEAFDTILATRAQLRDAIASADGLTSSHVVCVEADQRRRDREGQYQIDCVAVSKDEYPERRRGDKCGPMGKRSAEGKTSEYP